MEQQLNGTMTGYKVCHSRKGNKDFTFVRDPLTRIFSQYEEMIARSLNNRQVIPKKFQQFIDGYENYKDYERDFKTPEDLTRRFETFFDDWDYTTVWDVHLSLQVPLLSDKKVANMYP